MPNVIEVVEQVKNDLPTRNVDGAIKLARELIDKLEIKEYPVPIIDVLNKLNIDTYVSKMPNQNISGFIIIDKIRNGQFVKIASVSVTDEYSRQRFTYAHEFGHFLFDYGKYNLNHYFDTYNLIKTDEISEAIPSRFAAEFLMPAQLFENRYKELIRDCHDNKELIINKLSSEFEVGCKAVLKRINELDLFNKKEEYLSYAVPTFF